MNKAAAESSSVPKRMDGYVRVSRRMGREGPGYISPSIQKDAVQRWADFRGVEIVAWHEDEDESGGTQQRPALREAMRRVLAGETDGIACWRLNRFARNVSEALADVKQLQAAGGSVAFVEEDIDPTGPFGEFVLTVLLSVAALELNNIKTSWKISKARAMERGAIVGPTPFGYARQDDGTLQLDAIAAPVVAQAFEIAGARGLRAALAHLLEHGAGRTWTTSTVRRALAQRCYLGEFTYGEHVHRDLELAIVGRATWEAAQPPAAKERKRAAHFPLSGLATCATCGTHMVGSRSGSSARPEGALRTYRCAASLTTWRGDQCPAPATTTADRLERYVREQAIAAAETHEQRVVDQGALDDALTGALRALRDTEAELDASLRDLGLRRTLGEQRYHHAIELRVKAVDDAQARYRTLAARAARTTVRVGVVDVLRDASPEDLGELLRGMVTGIEVTRGRGRIEDRVRLVALDDEPTPGVTPMHHP